MANFNLRNSKALNRYIILIFLILSIGCSKENLKFEHQNWIEAKDNASWKIRKSMAQDLINRQLLENMNKNQVIRLLGDPETFADVPENEMYYTIEEKYGYDIDPIRLEYLIVKLKTEEKVVESYYRKVVLDRT
ncbi:hypothetical protein [Cohnella sp. AR92]|uniref:hypothetical protein n=1 Tax=Cohnella sp. AR92 TaxID=648716 RepID=UPI000F8E6B2C|nr:hypothetical protein [Cohnella sp. AR92]RUS45857.1 hypothetical protein ELR57_18575 [Cohnella sp. AR92]